MKRFDEFLNRLHKVVLFLIALALTIVITVLNLLIGSEISLYVFYVIPIGMISWYIGSRPVSAIYPLFCALLTGYANYQHRTEFEFNLVWNVLAIFIFFSLISLLIDSLRRMIRHLRELTIIDPLTQVLNRRGLYRQIEYELNKAYRYNETISIAYIDLDNFKYVNDHYGHEEGDRLLIAFTDMIKKSVRQSDVFGRVGGDEFVIFLPQTSYENSEKAIYKIKKVVEALMKENDWPVTLSIGIITMNDIIIDAVAAIRITDELMYDVKKKSKNAINHIMVNDDLTELDADSA